MIPHGVPSFSPNNNHTNYVPNPKLILKPTLPNILIALYKKPKCPHFPKCPHWVSKAQTEVKETQKKQRMSEREQESERERGESKPVNVSCILM